MLRNAFDRSPVDLLGAGAVLVSVAGLTAVFVALGARPAPELPSRNVNATVVLAVRHPADRHDDAVPLPNSDSVLRHDMHHPADRHDQP